MDNELESQNEDPIARMIAIVALGHAVGGFAATQALVVSLAKAGIKIDEREFHAAYREIFTRAIKKVGDLHPILAEMLSDDSDPLASLWD